MTRIEHRAAVASEESSGFEYYLSNFQNYTPLHLFVYIHGFKSQVNITWWERQKGVKSTLKKVCEITRGCSSVKVYMELSRLLLASVCRLQSDSDSTFTHFNTIS